MYQGLWGNMLYIISELTTRANGIAEHYESNLIESLMASPAGVGVGDSLSIGCIAVHVVLLYEFFGIQ